LNRKIYSSKKWPGKGPRVKFKRIVYNIRRRSMNVILEINIFTKLALWADSVCYPPCMSVCLFVCPSVKNPAYGRHRISQPMQIVAPILFFLTVFIQEIADFGQVLIKEKEF
jgi:hypothetical protein